MQTTWSWMPQRACARGVDRGNIQGYQSCQVTGYPSFTVNALAVVVKYRHRAIVLLFLKPEWALSQSMRLKAEWAIDLEAMRARGIIVLVKSSWLVKNIDNKNILAS